MELIPSTSIRTVPIYEYVCMECESHFEELVRGEEQVACPDCAATNVSRQFSSFAVHGVTKVATVAAAAAAGAAAAPAAAATSAGWHGGTKRASC